MTTPPQPWPPDWPLAAASRSVDAGGVRWHVQLLGAGPPLLLLHGTGASTHSFRDVAPLLAERWTVVMPDLPGHGWSSALPRGAATLPGIATALAALLQALRVAPVGAVGHSAGAAITARLALAAGSSIERLAWLNAALLPFDGVAGLVFAPLARWLAGAPGLARLAAWRSGDDAAVRRLVAATGSTLDARGLALYRRLVSRPEHVAGALAMMAGWDLQPLHTALPRLAQPVLLLAADGDRTVPPAQSQRVAARLPNAVLERLPRLGHLAHEEAPAPVARRLADWFSATG